MMKDATTFSETRYQRRLRAATPSRRHGDDLDPARGTLVYGPAIGLVMWIAIYAVGWTFLRFVTSVHYKTGFIIGAIAIVVLVGLWCRERYENALADRRAGIR